MRADAHTIPAQHEADESPAKIYAYAVRLFQRNGIAGFQPSKLSKRIRTIHRESGARAARAFVDSYFIAIGKELYAATWAGFERYAWGGYRDETGGRAAANVDRIKRVRS